MPRIAYVNGRYVAHRDASVHIEDRGYQFADGVYEVCGVWHGRLMDEQLHLSRLERSLAALRIDMPMSEQALRLVLRELVRQNRVEEGLVYLQVTRGVAPRDHGFPSKPVAPALVITAKRVDRRQLQRAYERGVRIVSQPDIRWRRRDIKSISLLPNVLAKQAAREAGAYEAWLVGEDGFVTEGASTNAWIIDASGSLRTHPLGERILPGVTRHVLVEAARRLGLRLDETPFTIEEACRAREAFITASTAILIPVIEIDGHPVGNGRPGATSQALRQSYLEIAELS